MSTISARPLTPMTTVKAPVAAAKPVAAAPAKTLVQSDALISVINLPNVDAVRKASEVGRFIFTPPVIVDVVKSSIKSGIAPMNLLWTAIPSAIRNVRDVFSGKASAGRAGANVATETTFGVGKGIISSIMVQSLSIATGPLLGVLPIPTAILPFAGIGVALVGMVGTYWVMNKVIKKTGIDQKMADGLTRLFGGDKAKAPVVAPPAKAAPKAATRA